MSIEQNIIDAVEISRHSHIPVLFMSNPGLGKTTILTKYAQQNKMHLETLIGSRFSPEEISGYMVNNGGDHLTHMSPEWFSRIQEKSKQGITTLLFVDELSTCSEFVQGALLSLIFDRSIGSGKFLPKDCLIVAAANYAGNLPGTMSIMAPTLNRFIIINLNDNYNALDLMQEFLSTPAAPKYPVLRGNFTENSKNVFMENFRNIWKEVFIKYSDADSSLGVLDISNQDIDGLYSDSKGCIYNFISGRSLSYLSRALMSYSSLGINNRDILHKIIDGLVGAGTCLFKEKSQAKRYREMLYKNFEKLVHTELNMTKALIPIVHDVSKDISSFLVNTGSTDFSTGDALKQLIEITNEVRDLFNIEDVMAKCKTETGIAKFVSDMDSIMELLTFLAKRNISRNTYQILTQIYFDYYGVYCEVLNMTPDYKKKFGMENNAFKQICFVRHKSLSGEIEYIKAAVIKSINQTEKVILYKLEKDELFSKNSINLKKTISGKAYEPITFFDGVRFIPLKDYMLQAGYIFRKRRSAS